MAARSPTSKEKTPQALEVASLHLSFPQQDTGQTTVAQTDPSAYHLENHALYQPTLGTDRNRNQIDRNQRNNGVSSNSRAYVTGYDIDNQAYHLSAPYATRATPYHFTATEEPATENAPSPKKRPTRGCILFTVVALAVAAIVGTSVYFAVKYKYEADSSLQPSQSTSTTVPPTTPTTNRNTTQDSVVLTSTTSAGPAVPIPCGVVRSRPQARIIGGSATQPQAYPWTVMFLINGEYNCGGSIISPEYVITAAHCIDAVTSSDTLDIVAGNRVFHYDSTDESKLVQKVRVSERTPHPNFNKITGSLFDSFLNDIAVLKLSEKLTYTSHVSPICLPETGVTLPPRCIVAGWGTIEAGNDVHPETLREVTLTTYDNSTCSTVFGATFSDYPEDDINLYLDQGVMCAANGTAGGIDACTGDSGGPLFCLLPNGPGQTEAYSLFGVVSWGDNCAVRGRPGFYAYVPRFNEWINSITEKGEINESTTVPTPTTPAVVFTSTSTTPLAENTTSSGPALSVPCGVVRSRPQARIIGGSAAQPQAYPWTVMFLINGEYNCGGSIVSPEYVITAAHCLEDIKQTDVLEIVAGAHTLPDESKLVQKIRVSEKTPHPNFNEITGSIDDSFLNDIAVLKLSQNLTYTSHVSPICLPKMDVTLPPRCIVAGWGQINVETGASPKELQEVTLTAYDNSTCSTVFGATFSDDPLDDINLYLNQGVMCAANGTAGGLDACSGDSGGPLFCLLPNGPNQTEAYSLFGVVSWGESCAVSGKAGFYAYVPRFNEWINNVTDNALLNT